MMQTDKMIGIVTVLYNSETVLEDFFRTLDGQTCRNFVLYLVDNASKDNTVRRGMELEKTVRFECKWLLQKENLGVAEGNNIGIEAALADGCGYVLLSNNDVVLQEDTIEKLMNGMRSMQATMAVPKIYYWDEPKKIWMAGGGFHWLQFSTYHRGEKKIDEGQYDNREFIQYAPTCFMLIDAEVFSRVGMMDSRYFVYYDDTDFVWRATKIGSEKLVYIPESVMWHKVSSCTGGEYSDFTIRYSQRNHIFFSMQYCHGFHFVLFVLYLIAHFFLKKVFLFTSEQNKLILKSYREGWNLYRDECKRNHDM